MRTGQNRQPNPWTDADIKRLRQLLLEHTPIPVIALRLGRTEGAVRTRAQQIGVSLRKLKAESPRG